jgi:hypothetical protein
MEGRVMASASLTVTYPSPNIPLFASVIVQWDLDLVSPAKIEKLLLNMSIHSPGAKLQRLCTFFNWASGSMVNDALRGAHVLTEMHKRCNFAPGECMLMFSNSFSIFAGLTRSRSHWTITDANKGMLGEGYVTVKDALAITRPSMLKGRGKRPSFKGYGKRSS